MLNLNDSKYFNSLPKITQESILQSGAHFQLEKELTQFVSNLERHQE